MFNLGIQKMWHVVTIVLLFTILGIASAQAQQLPAGLNPFNIQVNVPPLPPVEVVVKEQRMPVRMVGAITDWNTHPRTSQNFVVHTSQYAEGMPDLTTCANTVAQLENAKPVVVPGDKSGNVFQYDFSGWLRVSTLECITVSTR